MFANVSLNEFVQVAEKWIVEEWKPPAKVRYWDSEPRRSRYSETDWHLWSHSHGGTPTVEQYSTYLEWNAMWCAVGTLLKTKPLAVSESYDYFSFENTLKERENAGKPSILARRSSLHETSGGTILVQSLL